MERRKLKYVSPEYQERLDNLATLLARPIGDAALEDTIEFDPIQGELFPADNIVLGEE